MGSIVNIVRTSLIIIIKRGRQGIRKVMPLDPNYWYAKDLANSSHPDHFWYDRRTYLPDSEELYPTSLLQVDTGELVLITKGLSRGLRGTLTGYTKSGRAKVILEDATHKAIGVTSLKRLDPEKIIGKAIPIRYCVRFDLIDEEPTGVLPKVGSPARRQNYA